jgi:hypothetical protein
MSFFTGEAITIGGEFNTVYACYPNALWGHLLTKKEPPNLAALHIISNF